MENWKFSLMAAALTLAACADLEPPVIGWGQPETANTKSVVALRTATGLTSLSVWIITSKDTTYISAPGSGLIAECTADDARILATGNIDGQDGSLPPRCDTVTANLARMTTGHIACSATLNRILLPGANELEIEVPRSICKISLEKVENRLTEGAYAGKPIRIEKVFIVNGIGRYRVFGNGSQQRAPTAGRWWFNPSGIAADSWDNTGAEGFMGTPDMSYASLDQILAYEESATLDINVYTCPNNTETDAWTGLDEGITPDTWTPRKTRMVLQCLIDGHRCYYPLTIDNLMANCHYIVRKLVITRYGTDSPDQPYDFATGTAAISLTNWDGLLISEII